MIPLLLGLLTQELRLEALDLGAIQQDWGKPRAGRSVDGNPLRIGGTTFEHGVGTHARSVLYVHLGGRAESFEAMVGVDDEVAARGSVEFHIYGDGVRRWRSGVMRGGDAARPVRVALEGVGTAVLMVTPTGDGIDYDHANWANSVFRFRGEPPRAAAPPVERAEVLTPMPGPAPRLTGPTVAGVGTGNPALHRLTATGARPMRFEVRGLPQGLTLDAATGQVAGSVAQPGRYRCSVVARNQFGVARRDFTFVVGGRLALTPPMGWNSWNVWGGSISQDKVLRAARAMVSSGLADHGWTYINIDDGWQGIRGGPHVAIQPNTKFPDMKELVGELHRLGLRAGIYSTPWRGSYEGHIGGSCDREDGVYDWMNVATEHHRLTNETKPSRFDNFAFGKYFFGDRDVRQWAEWGFDFLKYDWNPWRVTTVQQMAELLQGCGRDIVYSLSNSAPFVGASDWARLSHLWRTTGDIVDTWGSVHSIASAQARWTEFAAPGSWNDPDMLVVGHLGWGPTVRPTRLTPNEQMAHISIWCILAAPLLLGCDLERLDAFTVSLLTNDEVLAVHQDPLGKQGRRVYATEDAEIWTRELADGSLAVLLLNASEFPRWVEATWAQLGLNGPRLVRDLWRKTDKGVADGRVSATLPRHGVAMVRLSPLAVQ